MSKSGSGSTPPVHFIRKIVDEDVAAGRDGGRVITRFPPEPNGYLHIGHAKSICLNFGLAGDFPGGICYLRFDDTNPARESEEFAAAIEKDVRWLGFDWGDRRTHASDYFEALYDYAVALIEAGKAYVCSLSAEEIRTYRGTLTHPGRESPYRDRPREENLDLFRRMRAGEFPDGAHVLRARIDMASGNLNLRDPTLYRIRNQPHQRTGDAWSIYPMYDFAHTLSDAMEGITHSLCTLEFEDHRPLYDWFLDNLPVPYRPRQIEFSRLSLAHTVVSKRQLAALVQGGHVDGWDDPRMPTLSGMRRRGYPPAAIREFCDRIGITKKDNYVEMGVLESCVREDLDRSAPRTMGVLRPLRLVIDNYPEGREDELEAMNHPNRPELGSRPVPFGRELYIEREDFMEDPPRKFFRLAPGREVRLRYAYFVRCESVEKDPATGEVIAVHCTYDPATRGGAAPDGRKVKGTIHWVSAARAVAAEVRLYDRLFRDPSPRVDGNDGDIAAALNPGSVEVLRDCRLEPSLAAAAPGDVYQLERQGYFCRDPGRGEGGIVLNRTSTLRDSWAKIERRKR